MRHIDWISVRTASALAGWLVCLATAGVQSAQPDGVILPSEITANRPQDARSDPSDTEVKPGSAENDRPPEGLWPSRKLLRLILVRYVDDACDRYDLDEAQCHAVRETTADQWTDWLTQRRSELEPLVNEYLEMRLGLEPPSTEQVKAWSDRALPAFSAVREQIEKTWDGFRAVMSPAQRARFEIKALKARAALAMAAAKLQQWREGTFDTSEVWEPRVPDERRQARKERRARRAERRQRIAEETEAAQPDQIALELDRWQQYVADFIERYQLDEGQRTTALSLLAEVTARATEHRDRHRSEIAALERRINNPTDDASERDSIKEELQRLYGPIDELFAELARRLEPIPTQVQRQSAERVKAEP